MKGQRLEFLGTVSDWSSINARNLVRFGGAERFRFSQLGYARELRAILTDCFRVVFWYFSYLVFGTVFCSLLPVEGYIHGNRKQIRSSLICCS